MIQMMNEMNPNGQLLEINLDDCDQRAKETATEYIDLNPDQCVMLMMTILRINQSCLKRKCWLGDISNSHLLPAGEEVLEENDLMTELLTVSEVCIVVDKTKAPESVMAMLIVVSCFREYPLDRDLFLQWCSNLTFGHPNGGEEEDQLVREGTGGRRRKVPALKYHSSLVEKRIG